MTSMAGKLAHQKERDQGVGTKQQAVQFQQQDYEALKKRCLETGKLFEDDKFPASSRSLGYNKLGPGSHKTHGVVWKRPTELCSKPTFIHGGATRTDICQGALGDCWLLAAIASLTLEQKILARVVPGGQTFDEGYAGIFHFQFWQYGEWVDVVVDDRLPTRDGELLFVHSETDSEFWSALLEKAYAKVNSCYEALSGGTTTEAFEDFTGGIAEIYDLSKAPAHLFKIIQKALNLDSLLGCAIDGQKTEAVTAQKLVKRHSYSVTGAQVVHQVSGRDVELIRIRNPWGKVEWNGAWSDGSDEWDRISADDRAKLSHASEDGEFWMSYSDFMKNFSKVEICNLTPDELSSDEKGRWNSQQCDGTWRVGSTAGGCRNYETTFHSNPQFAVRLEDVDDDPLDGQDGCTLIVGLMQKDGRRGLRLGRELNTIGFTIYEVQDTHKGQTDVHLGRDVLLRTRSVAMTTFIDSREVCERYNLPPGEYVIIPSTFEPHKRGSFVLRIFSEKDAPTREMEEDIDVTVEETEISESDVDPRFKPLFRRVAGNDSEVSVFELVRVLNEVISQKSLGVKTDGFSLETGRQIVSLLDQDGSTTLGLVEFHTLWMKIQKYLVIFKTLDSDGSGTMSSHEMREALTMAGFKVNSAVLEVIVDHYADARYTIDFDSYVGCLIKLEMLFKMFKTLESNGSGKIELDIQQWLCLAIN
ncbi:calpain-2 catalytic subunit-like [Engraulis encrasicolus]|uniref:calpain-2 catalytic subunit-like n=1 Tax=Engraulis encrasicolus TaxID=184585 RepID=UPI002FD043C1